MIKAPHMLLLGSESRHAGKTYFACAVIAEFAPRHTIVGVKVTPGWAHDYTITEEPLVGEGTDTQRLLEAGAHRAYWVRTSPACLAQAAAELLDAIGDTALIVAESTGLRRVVEPGVFLIFRRDGETDVKASARAVQQHADRVVVFDGHAFDLAVDDLAVIAGRWTLRRNGADAHDNQGATD